VASTEKISLSLDVGALVLARRAAQIEGVSLSAWMSRLVREHAWDSQRLSSTPEEQARRDERDAELDEQEVIGWGDGREHRAAG
jgi:hypothetical protein